MWDVDDLAGRFVVVARDGAVDSSDAAGAAGESLAQTEAGAAVQFAAGGTPFEGQASDVLFMVRHAQPATVAHTWDHGSLVNLVVSC